MFALLFLAAATAQTPAPDSGVIETALKLFGINLNPDEILPDILNYTKEIGTGAVSACSNNFITGPYIESVLCGNLIPASFLSFLPFNITFGPSSKFCFALACAYRGMGCAGPTYRVESDIILATGAVEPDCGTAVGLDNATCATMAKFIATTSKKRALPLGDENSAEAFDDTELAQKPVALMSDAEKRFAEQVAATAVRAYYPGQHFAGLDERVPVVKRDTISALLSQLQVCSPLIAAGIQLLSANIQLPINFTGIVGPCGIACNLATCALNLLCADEAAAVLNLVQSQRTAAACTGALECASFEMAPPSVCANVTCPHPDSYFNTVTCPPPNSIHVAGKTSITDCCSSCQNTCGAVNCPSVPKCDAPVWPLCSITTLGKASPYDCCPQCLNACFGKTAGCPATPASCPSGSILGPSHPGDCCLSCQPKCAGIDCTGTPHSQSDCAAGQQYVAPLNGASDNPTQCTDCCGKCTGTSLIIAPCTTGACPASTITMAAGAVIALLLALVL